MMYPEWLSKPLVAALCVLAISGFAVTLGAPANANETEDEMTFTSDEFARGKAWYTTCSGCHGNYGEGLKSMKAPHLAGVDSAYLYRQLMAFRDDTRGGAKDFYGVMMNGRAKALGEDKAVRDVVAFISTLPTPEFVPSSSVFEAGAELYETCAACHGDNAEGIAEVYGPALRGHEKDYLVRTLKNYKSDVRGWSEDDILGSQMRASVSVLEDDAQIEAVSEYIASLGNHK